MKNLIAIFLILLGSSTLYAQVGIGTTDPKGALDIVTTNDTGIVIPRVSSINSVTDGDGNPPVEGTMVFDISKNRLCIFAAGDWICLGLDDNGNPAAINTSVNEYELEDQSYFKASNTSVNDYFGMSVAISGDGLTMAIGAPHEGSTATTINGDQTNTSSNRGAVYVFHNNGIQWQQQAYIKPSTLYFSFGHSVSLDLNGNTLAVGRDNEVFIFRRISGIWTEQQQITYPQLPFWGRFGGQVDLSNDGNTIAISAYANTSLATGVGADQTHSTGFVRNFGGTYIYSFNGIDWVEEEFFKANVTDEDFFGFKIALSGDASVLAVSAPFEDSDASGVNGDENNNLAENSGAVYVYKKLAGVWQFDAYLKASNADPNDRFGSSLAISGDGHSIVIGAPNEACGFPGINASAGSNNFKPGSGAAYVFNDNTGSWLEEAYIKNSILDNFDLLGYSSVAINENGNVIAIGSYGEDSLRRGILNEPSTNNDLANAGAVLIFQKLQGNWIQTKMLKASNPLFNNNLSFAENNLGTLIPGSGVVFVQLTSNNISMSTLGDTIIVGSLYEDSNATGIQGDQDNTAAPNSGAVYLYKKID